MTQVQDVRRGSALAPRRSSVVVSQNLGAILGKTTSAGSDAGAAPEVVAAMLATPAPAVSRPQGQAFFPDLSLLTKVGVHALRSLPYVLSHPACGLRCWSSE